MANARAAGGRSPAGADLNADPPPRDSCHVRVGWEQSFGWLRANAVEVVAIGALILWCAVVTLL